MSRFVVRAKTLCFDIPIGNQNAILNTHLASHLKDLAQSKKLDLQLVNLHFLTKAHPWAFALRVNASRLPKIAILQFFLNRKSLTARDLRVQISRFDFRLVYTARE